MDKTAIELKSTAVHYLTKGNSAKAKKLLYKVLMMDALDVFARKKLAEIFERDGNIEAAVDHYERLIDVYANKGHRHFAIAIAKKIVEIYPFSAKAKSFLEEYK